MMPKLSVVIATKNEEANIARCLESVQNFADEIIIVDENSQDKTREIAKKFDTKVFLEPHHDIFHITKQKALEKATGDWILQLDADEVVTAELAGEIGQILRMTNEEILKRDIPHGADFNHFMKHQRLIEERDGKIGQRTGEIVAFFIPRLNIFLGKPLRYGGVYPDGVIRLIKRGRARFPQKSVHEQMEIDGEVAWLFNPLKHYDSPTLKRYFLRMNRYTDLHAKELETKNAPKTILHLFYYALLKPLFTFFNIYFRHKGFLDGPQGFLWAFFSSMRFTIAYFKYLTNKLE